MIFNTYNGYGNHPVADVPYPMQEYETKVELISGDKPETAKYKITDWKGASTVIDAKRLADLTGYAFGFEDLKKRRPTERDATAGNARLSAMFVKEIRAAKKE
jgi:hypothetical protein